MGYRLQLFVASIKIGNLNWLIVVLEIVFFCLSFMLCHLLAVTMPPLSMTEHPNKFLAVNLVVQAPPSPPDDHVCCESIVAGCSLTNLFLILPCLCFTRHNNGWGGDLFIGVCFVAHVMKCGPIFIVHLANVVGCVDRKLLDRDEQHAIYDWGIVWSTQK